ncbi:hypothetical protein ES703_66383 [subsurface metagenome]
MYLVDKEYSLLLIELAPFLGFLDYSSQVGDAGADGAYRAEVRLGGVGDDKGERRLAAAGGSPENQ